MVIEVTSSLVALVMIEVTSIVGNMVKKNRIHFTIAVLLTTLICSLQMSAQFVFLVLGLQS